MVTNNKLVIINNEKVSQSGNSYYCENIDIKSIPEGLSKYYQVDLIVRAASKQKSFLIDLKKIKIASNIFNLTRHIFDTLKDKKSTYLLISITPFTFFSFLILALFKRKIFVYLRSSGYEEYKAILGSKFVWVYHFMYTLMTWKTHIIVCHKRLAKKNDTNLVFPSQISDRWFLDQNKPDIKKIKLLYVGRIKVEKGIFSLLNLLKKVNLDMEISIVGDAKNVKLDNNNLHLLGTGFDTNLLIKIYDQHNIFILPSFTEAHPQVLDESLARLRPVIIFKEIKHVINDKIGIFVSERNAESLREKINYIMSNYGEIQNQMKKNKLPSKKDFIFNISKIMN